MKLLLTILIVYSSSLLATENIVIIYVDEKTEESLGSFPLARSNYAKLVKVASKHEPKYIILKFFFDAEKDGDDVLINEVKKHKNVLTQAFSYQGQEKSSLDISKYSIPTKDLEPALFESLIFPYEKLASSFSGVGFVNGIATEDGRAKDFEIVSSFKGEVYPSLPLLILEKELNSKTRIQKQTLRIGEKVIKLSNDFGMKLKLKKPGTYKSYSMIDIMDGKIEKKEIQNKILIVFYNGAKLDLTPATNGHSYNPAEVVANAIDHILNL